MDIQTINTFVRQFPYKRDMEAVRWYPCKFYQISSRTINFYPKNFSKKPLALYFYIPFCKSRCNYCPFYSLIPNEDLIKNYLFFLEKEMNLLKKQFSLEKISISAIWIGGGDPSSIGFGNLFSIIKKIATIFDFTSDCEFTLEMIPGGLKYPELRLLKTNSPINRVSIGVESFHDKYLKMLKRPAGANTKKEILESIEEIKKAGFEISVDLMYRLPGQSIQEWEGDLKIIPEMEIDHALCISLVEIPGTELSTLVTKKKIPTQPSLEIDGLMYFRAKEILGSQGYKHYTVLHFSKPGKESLYISLRWKAPQGYYLGLGPAASSFTGNWVYSNVCNFKEYIEYINQGCLPVKRGAYLDVEEKMARFMVLGVQGFIINKEDFKKEFNKEIDDVYSKKIDFFKKYNLTIDSKKDLHLAAKGEFFVNNLSKAFFTNSQKDANRFQQLAVSAYKLKR